MEFPADEEVLAHGFRFRPSWWTPRVPDGWGAFLEQLPAEDRGYRTITRANLLETAGSRGLSQSLLAGYVWGTGSSAFLVGRRARVFRDNDSRRVEEALHAAAEMLRSGNTVDAYTAMLRGQPHYLKHLGPSFFTKFLYAADARGGRSGRALILDQFVAVALKAVDGWDISRYGPWDPSTYARWIDHAHSIAAADGARADAVEIAYFNEGRKIAARR